MCWSLQAGLAYELNMQRVLNNTWRFSKQILEKLDSVVKETSLAARFVENLLWMRQKVEYCQKSSKNLELDQLISPGIRETYVKTKTTLCFHKGANRRHVFSLPPRLERWTHSPTFRFYKIYFNLAKQWLFWRLICIGDTAWPTRCCGDA